MSEFDAKLKRVSLVLGIVISIPVALEHYGITTRLLKLGCSTVKEIIRFIQPDSVPPPNTPFATLEDGLRITKFRITNSQYDKTPNSAYGSHFKDEVSWDDASNFCRETFGVILRLPTRKEYRLAKGAKLVSDVSSGKEWLYDSECDSEKECEIRVVVDASGVESLHISGKKLEDVGFRCAGYSE